MPARTPEVIVVLRADRGRQAPGLRQDVDRRRLPVVAREEYRGRPFFRRQRLIGAADQGGQLAPAEHVGIELWHTAGRQLFLVLLRNDAEEVLVSRETFDRK